MEEIKHTFKIDRIMEDYTVDFQDVVDSFTLDELKNFLDRVEVELLKRLNQEETEATERLELVDKIRKKS